MQNPIIEVSQVCKRYGRIEALRDVSLSLNAGTFLTLLGPNGSGKTTLIRILAALTHPTSGYVKLDKLDPKTHGNEVRKKIGVVSHHPFLYNSLTADENLMFYGQMFGIPHIKETVEHLLRDVGLFSRRYDLVRTFSRGMQQRLSIARALLHNPLILLLDEPYTGLDDTAVNIFQNILECLHHEGRTILLTTHNSELGLKQCDNVAILVNGRLVYSGPPAKIRIIPERSDSSSREREEHVQP